MIEVELKKTKKWDLVSFSELKRDFDDQTFDFDPTIENIIIYKLYVIQNIEVKTNYGNTIVVKNKLYENYEFFPGSWNKLV